MICVDGVPVKTTPKPIYVMLNKPRGYVTTVSDEQGRKTVMDLLRGIAGRIYPVGRLDMDSEGLLLLTNDGVLAQGLLHPSHEVSKEYYVTVSGALENAAERLAVSGMSGAFRFAGTGAAAETGRGTGCFQHRDS